MNPDLKLWLIPILPLAGAAVNGFFGRKSSRQAVTIVGLFFSGAAFAWALGVALRFSSLELPYQEYLAHWIRSGNRFVGVGLASWAQNRSRSVAYRTRI